MEKQKTFSYWINQEFEKAKSHFFETYSKTNPTFLQAINEEIREIMECAVCKTSKCAEHFNIEIDEAELLAQDYAIKFLKKNLVSKEAIKKEVQNMVFRIYSIEEKQAGDNSRIIKTEIINSKNYSELDKYFNQIFGGNSSWAGMISNIGVNYIRENQK